MLLTRNVFRRLCRARDMLADATDEAPSVRDIASEVEISPFHFIRQFEAVFGVTPHQFRIRSRIDRAKHLLVAGDLSVTDVCMEVGFSSLGTFSDLFARRVGAPPSAYRRRARAMIQVPCTIAPSYGPGCFQLLALLPASAFAISKKRSCPDRS